MCGQVSNSDRGGVSGQQFYYNTPQQQPRYLQQDYYSPFRYQLEPSPFQAPPQSFSTFQQGAQVFHNQRAPSFLDQITLSPGGFRDPSRPGIYPSAPDVDQNLEEDPRRRQELRTRSRFSPTTRAPVKVKQFHIKNNKVSFSPKRQSTTTTSTTPEPQEYDDYSDSEYEDSASYEELDPTTHAVNATEPVKNDTDIPEYSEEYTTDVQSHENNSTFEILTMNPGHTLVEEDNFKGFVDSALIDATEAPTTPDAKPLGVSVVTTKSVINGTMFAVATPAPEVTKPTESWVIVASVQTSRSVSGARFLPSSAVKQEEHPRPLAGKPTPSSTDSPSSSSSTSTTTTTTTETSTTPTTSSSTSATPTSIISSSTTSSSATESIIDKLYRVESELSSGILTGGYRPSDKKLQLEILTDMSTTSSTTTSSTTPTTTTYKSPVMIRKFQPRTTAKPKKVSAIFESIPMDDLTGLLPAGFKARAPTRRTTTTSSPLNKPQGDSPRGRSTGLSHKNKVEESSNSTATKKLEDLFSKIKFDDVSALLPPGYKLPPEDNSSTTAKPKGLEGLISKARIGSLSNSTSGHSSTTPKSRTLESLLAKAKPLDVSSLLPPGYKLPSAEVTSTTTKPKGLEALFNKAKPVDISSLLPSGYKPPKEETPGYKPPKPENNSTGIDALLAKAKPVDISSLLPPGYKPSKPESNSTGLEALLAKARPVDVSSLLPPGYKPQKEEKNLSSAEGTLPKAEPIDVTALLPPGYIPAEENATSSTEAPGTTAFKIKFPTRPGVTRKPLLPTHKPVEGPDVPTPKINKGWPTR